MLHSRWIAGLIGVLAGGAALACGGNFFEENLLDSRALSLSNLPRPDRAFEYALLGKRVTGLGQVKQDEYDLVWGEEFAAYYAEQRAKEEERELTPAQFAKVQELRALTNAADAEAGGATLPDELRYYVAGAVAMANGDSVAAIDYFGRVLDLPPEKRRLRSTWAAYSLGRLQLGAGTYEAGLAAYREVRKLAAAGFPDPLHLAIASLGEEARYAKELGNWDEAIRLYASQAQHGSAWGRSSLRQLANEVLASSDSNVLAIPEVQELLAAHLLSSIEDSPVNVRLLSQVAARAEHLTTLAHADRFAALAYRAGDYVATQRFLALAGDAGMAWWLRAKLAVREGDLAKAREAYARAARAFPKDELWEPATDASTKPHCRVQAEAAILTLARGDFIAALEELHASTAYESEATDLAERVLTADELKAFVDRKHLATGRLGHLLGRRLLREGRYEEALVYFNDPKLRQLAREYGEQRRAAKDRWTRRGRAEAAYRAAVIAREGGMELLGYEHSPDFAVIDGLAYTDAAAAGAGQWVTAKEIERRNASRANPDRRFHYRWVAADLANEAADLVPARSQAFAATLCHATRWLIDTDESQAQSYYRRYVEEGPFVPWADRFGRVCPEPNFAAAEELRRQQQWQQLRVALRTYKWLVVGTGVVLLGFAGWLLVQRSRRRSGQGNEVSSQG